MRSAALLPILACLLTAEMPRHALPLGEKPRPLTSNLTQELVTNGSFEQGTPGWSGTTQNIGLYTDRPNFDGTHHAWLGGYGKVQSDDLYQTVAIPSDATSATLRFALNVTTQETESKAYDYLYVQVRSATGTQVLSTLDTITNLNAGGGYLSHSYDLSTFRGQSVQIRFYTVEDSNLATSWDLDQVSLVSTSGAGGLDLTVDNVYITQSTQTYSKSVPLVHDRRGELRVFVKANQANTARPNVKVRLSYNGALGHEFLISPNSGMTGIPTSIDTANFTTSYNAYLPKNWIQPGLQIWAQVDPEGAVPESNKANNVWPASGMVTENVSRVAPFRVTLVPLRLASTGRTSVAAPSTAETYVEFLRRMHPVPEDLDVQVHSVYTTSANPESSYGPQWTQVWNEMNALQRAEGQTRRHYYGCLNPNYSSGGTGLGAIGGFYAVGVEWFSNISGGTSNWRAGTFAHEVGHNFGRYHSPCGNPAGPDPNYPYANASIGVLGYDVWNNWIFDPKASNWTDVMAYCGYDWISDYTYRGALAWREQNATFASAVANSDVRDCLLVWGRVESGRVVLEPAFRVKGVPDVPSELEDFLLEAKDASGRTLLRHALTMDAADHSPDRSFAVLVPLPAADFVPGGIHELHLSRNGESLARQSRVRLSQATRAQEPMALQARRGQVRVIWDGTSHPIAMIKDPATGQVLGFLRGGDVQVATEAREVEIHFSDGVDSWSQILRVQ
jgi:hypothetical protein